MNAETSTANKFQSYIRAGFTIIFFGVIEQF